MDNGEQIFKITTYQWFIRFLAYSKGELEKAPSRYLEFQKYMKAANSAIRAANIEGVDTISENPADIDIINLNTRRTKLKNFAFNIKREADELIDDPFVLSMTELLGDIADHSKFQVNYNGEVNSIEYGEVGAEYINKLFQSLIESNDKDSQELTGDPKVDYWVKRYTAYDASSDKYGFEKENAVANGKWDTLSPEKQEALRHIYEHNFRVMEHYFNANTKEGKESQDILNRMNTYLLEKKYSYNNEVTATNFAKGLLSLMDEKAHSYEMLETIAEKHAWFQAPIYSKDAYGNDTNYQLMGNKISLRYEYDKAGIRLVFKNEYQENGTTRYYNDFEIGYYTSLSRCIDYVKYQENLDPGCYQHQKEIGITTNLIADFLLAADSSKDMQFIDNMTKNKGESYDKIFVGNPEGMTVSGWGAIVLYNSILSERWYKFNDEAARQEAARMNAFLREGNTEYVKDYYNYYNTAMYQMQTGDLDVESDMGILEAYLIGVESEFITWPTAINAMFETANEMRVSYMSMDEVSKISSVGYDYESNPKLYEEIRFGMLEGKTIQQRLSCYKYVGENRDKLGVTLNNAALEDLRNIYFSYLRYSEDRAINLYATEKEQIILDELYYILYNNDPTFKKSEDYRLKQNKVAEASSQHPIALFLGKASGDVVIYGGFSAATAGLGGGLEQALGGFTSRVISGTAADIIIKDLPKAITSYMQGEEFSDVLNDFTCEVMLDALANVGGEALGGVVKKATDAVNTKIGKDLVDGYMGAANKSDFLKNLSNKNLTRMVAQMDGKAAAKVLESFNDDGIKAILNGLSPEKAKYILDEMFNTADVAKREFLTKTFAPEGPSFTDKLNMAVDKRDAELLAKEIRKNAINAEPKTTEIMKSLEGNNGHLEGLEYRLKSEESLSRKILTDSHRGNKTVKEAADEINDSLRYTLVFDEAGYTKNVDQALNKLREQGYVVEKLKNTWGDDVYQGINCTLTSPEGVKTELQFHTDASYYTKDLNHQYYEIARSEFATYAEKTDAVEIMRQNQAKVKAPAGVNSIGRQMEITPEAKLAKTEAVQQASKINKMISGDNVSDNVAIAANKEANKAIKKVGKELGYSDKVVKKYSKKIEDIEFEYYENELKKARNDWNTPVSKQEVIDYRRTKISDAEYYKGVANKKLNGMDAILQYKNRFDAGAFDKSYSLDDILECKITKNVEAKEYVGILHSEYLPTVDKFISDEQVIKHVKEALPENGAIQECNTLQEIANQLYKDRPSIDLVVFQSREKGANNIARFGGNLGDGSKGFREAGVYSVPKYKLKEYAANYSDICAFENGKFVIYDYETFGKEVLSGVPLKNEYGVYLIETNVPFNGKNIGMPSVKNSSAYMDEFVSGGYLRAKPEIEITQKQLSKLDIKAGKGRIDKTKYTIIELTEKDAKVFDPYANESIYDDVYKQYYDPDYDQFYMDLQNCYNIQSATDNINVKHTNKDLDATIKKMNTGSIDDALELFKKCDEADFVNIIEKVDTAKAALMVDTLSDSQMKLVVDSLSVDAKSKVLDKLSDIRWQKELAKDTTREAIDKMESWRDILKKHDISEDEIKKIVALPMIMRTEAETKRLIEIYNMINQEESRTFLSKSITQEDALNRLTNKTKYKGSVRGYVARMQDCKGVITANDYIQVFGLNYLDNNTGLAPFFKKDNVQFIRFSSNNVEDAFIPFGGNNEVDRVFMSQLLPESKHKNIKVYPRPFDGGGVTMLSSLDTPGEILHAPGAPELYIDNGMDFKTAFMYNVDNNGNEVLIGVYDIDTCDNWILTPYGEEFIRMYQLGE